MVRTLSKTLLLSVCLMILTGCPGPGDRMVPDETSLASSKGGEVCIKIKDAKDYQPVAIAINLRGTSSKEKKYNFSPDLIVSDGELCIPSSFYGFVSGNKYIVEFYCARPEVIMNQEVLLSVWGLIIIKYIVSL